MKHRVSMGRKKLRTTDEDEQLVALAQQGDTEALERLQVKHRLRVFRVCIKIVKDPHFAENVTQETFFQVFRSIRQFRGNSAFTTWLTRIAINKAMYDVRREASRRNGVNFVPIHEITIPNKYSSPATLEVQPALDRRSGPFPCEEISDVGKLDAAIESTSSRLIVQKIMSKLNEEDRKLLVARLVKEQPLEEIAAEKSCSIGTIKSRIHYAIAHFLHALARLNNVETKFGWRDVTAMREELKSLVL